MGARMSSPFSKDYKAQIDSTVLARETSASTRASSRRARLLQSPDPVVRAQALGNLGPLSGNRANVQIKKPSHLG